mmetsp:Transcript_91511/g.218146  ORF Transcript_91511/g.218146 Transcript_91511/m.218146 type:complete len:86 (+) Transcript_91511:1500-1757(+)
MQRRCKGLGSSGMSRTDRCVTNKHLSYWPSCTSTILSFLLLVHGSLYEGSVLVNLPAGGDEMDYSCQDFCQNQCQQKKNDEDQHL